MKANLLKLWNKGMKIMEKNAPAMLAGTAIVGVITTAYFVYKATPKAEEVLDRYKKRVYDIDQKRVSNLDQNDTKMKALSDATKDMIPIMIKPVLSGGLTIGAIIGSQSISKRRIAALSAVCSMSQNTIETINEKIVEVVGEKKAREVKDAVAKKKFDSQDNGSDKSNIVVIGNGDVLCQDSFTGGEFYSNPEHIRQCILRLSSRLSHEMFISLNELRDEIGLDRLGHVGDDLGWSVDDCPDWILPINLTSHLNKYDRPCLYIDYDFIDTRYCKRNR